MKILSYVLLILFLILSFTMNMRFWLPLFIVGMIFSLLKSRFYCRYICPVGTVNKSLKLYSKKRKPIDKQKAKYFGYVIFSTFLSIFILSLVTRQRIELFLFITIIGILFSLLISPLIWCGYYCPWGRTMTICSSLTKKQNAEDNTYQEKRCLIERRDAIL